MTMARLLSTAVRLQLPFIRTLIERQLKGRWSRTAVDNSLAIVIRWPDNVPTN